MTSIKRFTAIPVAILLSMILLPGCGDGGGSEPTGNTGPTVGTFTVTLESTAQGALPEIGAIQFRLSGPGITQVTAVDGSLYFRSEKADWVTVILLGDVTAGDMVTFRVPDVDALASYSTTILAVADRDNEMMNWANTLRLRVRR